MSISNTSMSLPMHSFFVKAGACPLLLVSLVTVLKKPIDYTHFTSGIISLPVFFLLWSCSRTQEATERASESRGNAIGSFFPLTAEAPLSVVSCSFSESPTSPSAPPAAVSSRRFEISPLSLSSLVFGAVVVTYTGSNRESQ